MESLSVGIQPYDIMQQSVAADAVEPFCGMRILPGEPAEIGQAGRMECPVTEYETPAQCPDDKQPEDCAQCSNDFLISLFLKGC